MNQFGINVIRERDPMIAAKQQQELEFRMDPGFWSPEWLGFFDALYESSYEVQPLGQYIKSITYGQVGRRYYDPEGEVTYLQTRNITPTGIDIHERSGRIKAGSWNDPDRSRLEKDDLLLVNSSRFAAGVRPIGKVLAVLKDPGLMNISQDIDKIRLSGLDPAYTATFILSKYGNSQIKRICSGVGSVKVNFDEVRSILIPVIPQGLQKQIRIEYLKIGGLHEAAMDAKGKLQRAREHGNGAAEERHRAEYERNIAVTEAMLNDLVRQVEEIIEGERTEVEPVGRILKESQG